jgi:predicted O-linked N-acetylglucosamine transferase (SPINDLY family)
MAKLNEIIQNIEKYELLIQNKGLNLHEETIKILSELKESDSLSLIRSKDGVIELNLYTRLAAALTQYFSIVDDNIEDVFIESLLLRKQTIINIFCASGYGNMGHLKKFMSQPNKEGLHFSYKKFLIYLSIIDIDDVPEEYLTLILKFEPKIIFKLLAGWLSQRAIFTEIGEKNRSNLFNYGSYIENAKISIQELNLIFQPWMYCTYSSGNNKNEIKKYFNKLILNSIKPQIPDNYFPKYVKKLLPKILVIHENFNSKHAMFRCYSELINSLNDKFKVVGFAETLKIDKEAEKIHSQTLTFDKSKQNIIEVIKLINSVKADIILYPSVGMESWAVALSNLRLAPIQIACQGHPATTNSDSIDYVISSEIQGKPEKIYSEKLLFINMSGPIFAAKDDLPKILPLKTRIDDGFIHIAVNSKIMKISYRLLNICRRLNLHSKVPIKFHFFPGLRPAEYHGISKKIKTQLHNVVVHEYLKYPEFLQEIKNCDFALAGLPFGNTNGTVDACLLGIPTVAYFGEDLASQTDDFVLNIAGFPSWLVNRSDEDYFNTALSLINKPELLEALNAEIDLEAVKSRLINASSAKITTEFSDVISYVHSNHLLLSSSSQRIIKYPELS